VKTCHDRKSLYDPKLAHTPCGREAVTSVIRAQLTRRPAQERRKALPQLHEVSVTWSRRERAQAAADGTAPGAMTARDREPRMLKAGPRCHGCHDTQMPAGREAPRLPDQGVDCLQCTIRIAVQAAWKNGSQLPS